MPLQYYTILASVHSCHYYLYDTAETRIKEPTFLGDSLLKALICCLCNSYIRDGESVSTLETRIKEPTF